MDRREITSGRPIVVPYLDDIRSLADEEKVAEWAAQLTAEDEVILDALKPHKLNPFSKIIDRTSDMHVLMTTAEPAPDEEIDLAPDELLKVTESLIAGRIKNPDEFDIAIAEEDCFYNLVSYIVNRNFEGRPETFAPELVESRDYGQMVTEIGDALIESADQRLRFDDPEGDESIADFVASIGGITTMALASGSRLVMKSALDYLDRIEKIHLPYGSPARDEAVAIEKLYNGLINGEFSQTDFESFKASLDSDWAEALDVYGTWGTIIDCRNIIRKVCDKEFDQVMASQIKRLYQRRMTVFRDYWLLDQRRYELRQPMPGNIEDSLTHEELVAQLDWTVLPRGDAELEKAAHEIVAGAKQRMEMGKEVKIDLERLNILKNIREYWGADRAYYARGTLDGRSKVSVNGEERPDEYIVLVLQDIAPNGEVKYEHAIAESPIAGPNAIYVLRGDVSTEYGWRNIYSLSKKRARELGARRVKHTKGDGSPQIDMLTQRLAWLLSCTPEEFAHIEFSGARVRIARQLGKIASQPAQ